MLICFARGTPIQRANRTVTPPPGCTPTRECVSAKRACSDAMRKSHVSASSSPPVAVAPLIAPITGFSVSSNSPRVGSSCACANTPPSLPASLRSTPAQNAGSVAGEDDHVDVVVGVERAHRVAEEQHELPRERVAPLRAIERHHRDAVGDVDEQDAGVRRTRILRRRGFVVPRTESAIGNSARSRRRSRRAPADDLGRLVRRELVATTSGLGHLGRETPAPTGYRRRGRDATLGARVRIVKATSTASCTGVLAGCTRVASSRAADRSGCDGARPRRAPRRPYVHRHLRTGSTGRLPELVGVGVGADDGGDEGRGPRDVTEVGVQQIGRELLVHVPARARVGLEEVRLHAARSSFGSRGTNDGASSFNGDGNHDATIATGEPAIHCST